MKSKKKRKVTGMLRNKKKQRRKQMKASQRSIRVKQRNKRICRIVVWNCLSAQLPRNSTLNSYVMFCLIRAMNATKKWCLVRCNCFTWPINHSNGIYWTFSSHRAVFQISNKGQHRRWISETHEQGIQRIGGRPTRSLLNQSLRYMIGGYETNVKNTLFYHLEKQLNSYLLVIVYEKNNELDANDTHRFDGTDIRNAEKSVVLPRLDGKRPGANTQNGYSRGIGVAILSVIQKQWQIVWLCQTLLVWLISICSF